MHLVSVNASTAAPPNVKTEAECMRNVETHLGQGENWRSAWI